MEWEVRVSRSQLLYAESINNKALLYSTGNCIQSAVENHHRKSILSFSITESLC